MKTTKPFEVIYITGIVTSTAEDGDVLTFLALDDYSKFLFPPQMKKVDNFVSAKTIWSIMRITTSQRSDDIV